MRGTRPVPPPKSIIFLLDLFIENEFPYGPRIPILSPLLLLNNEVDPYPFFLIVIAAYFFLSLIITLRGSSSFLGIQTIKNCPGFDILPNGSLKTKVLTVGDSTITSSISTILIISLFMGNSDYLLDIIYIRSF